MCMRIYSRSNAAKSLDGASYCKQIMIQRYCKSSQSVSKAKKLDIIQWPSQVTWLDFNPTEHALQLLQSGQKWRKNHKQEKTVGGCSEDLAEHLKEETQQGF